MKLADALLLSSALLSSCGPSKPAAERGLSSAELFHLRSECAGLGDKLKSEWTNPKFSETIVSHYDVVTNRCYAELDTVGMASNPPVADRSLYDGQTGELLMVCNSDERGKTSSLFQAPDYVDRISSSFEQICGVIDRIMSENRQWDKAFLGLPGAPKK